jgi:hypothetical protein
MADGDFLGFEDGSGHLLLENGVDALLLEKLVPPIPVLPVVSHIWWPSGTPYSGTAYDLRRVVAWSADDDPDYLRVQFGVEYDDYMEDEPDVVRLPRAAFEQAMTLYLPFVVSRSVSFDGLTEYVTVPDVGYLTGEFSFSAWVKTTEEGPAAILGSRSGVLDPLIGIDDQRLTVSTLATTAQTAQNVGGFRDGNWHHLVITKDATSTLVFYIDGTAYPVTVGSSSLFYSLTDSQGWYLARGKDGDYYTGNLDGLTLWVVALSAGEVAELYNGGTPLDPRLHTQAAELRSWWRCGEADVSPDLYDAFNVVNGTMVNMDDSNFSTDAP